MIKHFKKILIVVFVLIGMHGHAQVWGTSFQNLTYVGTVSPQAASYGKFGNIPVSYCTGIPSITIPLYDINFGEISIPVSLDYHAGGIKVDETSSSVGIGWALNGVGVISRMMVGRPDELDYIGSTDAATIANAPQNYFSFLYSFENNQKNVDPDIYQYNVNGLSGKFIFRPDGSIMQIPVTNNKIIYSGGNFTIIDDKGNSYVFEEKRTTSSSEITDPSYVSTWCQTKMIASNNVDVITFTYESTIYSTYEKIINFTQTFGYNITTQSIACQDGFNKFMPIATQDVGPHQVFQTITNQEYYPKEIDWRGGKIVFNNVNDRIDVTGSGLRLDHIDIYSLSNGVYTFIKRKKLWQTYLSSNPGGGTVTEKNYRLELNKVEDEDINSNSIGQVYNMVYNTTPIAPRGSFAQDRWGFYNGHNENTDLIPKQTFAYNTAYYTFGGAIRDANPTAILACTLTSIEYPTKGKSVLELEPHQFHTSLSPPTTLKNITAQACCGTSSSDHQTFTPASNQSNFRYNIFISRFDNASPAPSQRPNAKLTDLTTGQVIMNISTQPPTVTNVDYTTGTLAINLTQGHQYALDVYTYTTSSTVTVTETIYWDEVIPGSTDIILGGGLRIKSLTNYDINGNFINKDVYTYGTDNTGVALTPQYYQDINYEQVVHRLGYASCSVACQYVDEANDQTQLSTYPGYSTIFHANSVLPASQYAGSPVLYSQVTKSEVDASGSPNGKTVYTYGVYEDGSSSPFQPITGILTNYLPKPGIYLINNTWKNGVLLKEETYKSITTTPYYQLVSSQSNQYTQSLPATQNVLKVKFNYTHTGCEVQGSVNDFTLSVVPVLTGAMLLTSTTSATIDNSGNELDKTQTYTYGTSSLLPSAIQTTSSKQQTLTVNLQYPKDLSAAGNVYQKMVNRNIVSPVVKSTQLNSGVQMIYQAKNYYDWFGNSNLLEPQTIDQQIRSNPVETRIMFNQMDQYGNILQQQKTNDVYQSYIWDYGSVYPVAKIVNAAQSDVAYTSFEADGKGNWNNYTGTVTTVSVAPYPPTGNKYYNLTTSATLSKSVSSGKVYIISYWSKNGSYSISGGTGTSITGRSFNSWTYYEHKITASSSTLTIFGTGAIDEVRLYPYGAQMNTYTYLPLIGMSSQCDLNNRITYYEYDVENRLHLIRDQDNNIIKRFDYQYQQSQ